MKSWPASSKRDRSYSQENSWSHGSCVGYFPEPRRSSAITVILDSWHIIGQQYLDLGNTILQFRNSWRWMTKLKSQEPSSVLLSSNSLCWWPHTWVSWPTAQDWLWCSVMEVLVMYNVATGAQNPVLQSGRTAASRKLNCDHFKLLFSWMAARTMVSDSLCKLGLTKNMPREWIEL